MLIELLGTLVAGEDPEHRGLEPVAVDPVDVEPVEAHQVLGLQAAEAVEPVEAR